MEAMEEKSVTVNGKTIKLQEPFIIIATQNPSDLSGTSLLPESQLDRFMISFSLNELNENDQIKVLKNQNLKENKIDKNINLEKIFKETNNIQVNDIIYKYILRISEFIKKS